MKRLLVSFAAGEDEAGPEGGETEEEDRVGGTIPPRLRAFKKRQKNWRAIKDQTVHDPKMSKIRKSGF